MQSSYRAVVMAGPDAPLEVREFRPPSLESGSALLHTLYSEVCGTDVHLHHGRLAGVPYPLIPGHVSVGHVAAVRGSLTTIDGDQIREGDLVTFLDVHGSCGNCYACLVTHQTTRCPARRVYGITYGANDGLLGGWSEAIWLKPGVRILPLPPDVDPRTYMGGGCGLVTAVHAVERAAVRLGDAVVILGAGPVGQSLAALCSLSGAREVIVVGAPPNRLAFATSMGATYTLPLDFSSAERLETVRQLTSGHGADVVIEASGAPSAVSDALDLVRDGGRVVVCGQYTDNGDVRIHPHWQINRKHVELRGCWGSDFSHFYRAVQLAARFGETRPWALMATTEYSLAEASVALAAVEARDVVKAIINPRL